MTSFDAVLWDMDGTLVDTEPLWMRGEYALAADYGATWTHEDGLNLVGRDLLDGAAYIRDRMDLPLTPEQIVDRLVVHMTGMLRERVPWRTGALPILREVAAAGIRQGLVTMSYRPLADIVAGEAGVFGVVVTGDEARRPKPHPDPYLQAAEALGVDPRRCIALEDSATGARSAMAAGCHTVVVAGYAPVPDDLGHARWPGLAEHGLAALRGTAAAASVES